MKIIRSKNLVILVISGLVLGLLLSAGCGGRRPKKVDKAELLYRQGVELEDMGRYEEALDKYQEVIDRYPSSRYALLARDAIDNINVMLLYERAKRAYQEGRYDEAIVAYQLVIDRYPDSRYAELARSEIIEAKVVKILSGRTTVLPSVEGIIVGDSSKNPTITINNNTGYLMRIMFSGPSPIEIIVAAGDTVSQKLIPGNYRIAAVIEGREVEPFSGAENFESGHEYRWDFYLRGR